MLGTACRSLPILALGCILASCSTVSPYRVEDGIYTVDASSIGNARSQGLRKAEKACAKQSKSLHIISEQTHGQQFKALFRCNSH